MSDHRLAKHAQVAATVLIVLVLLLWIKPWESFSTLAAASPILILLALAGVGIALSMNAGVYAYLLRPHGIPFGKIWGYSLYSWVAESYLPGKIGSFAFAFLLRKENVTLGEGLATVLAYRASLALAALAIGVWGLVHLFGDTPTAFAGIGIALGLSVIAGLLVMGFKTSLRAFIPVSIREKLSGFSRTMQRLRDPNVSIPLLAFAFGQVGAISFVYSLMLEATGYSVGFVPVLIATCLTQITALIPLTINGIGIREGTMGMVLAQAGVPIPVTVGVSVVNTAVSYALSFVLSTYLTKKIPFDDMKKAFVSEKK